MTNDTPQKQGNRFKSSRRQEESYPLPSRLRLTRQPTCEEVDEFLAFLKSHRRVPAAVEQLFCKLAYWRPNDRLTRNLKIVLDRLRERPINDFMRDALLEDELEALILLASIETRLQEVGQALLNVHERYQLAEACRTMYERGRRNA